MLRHHFSRRLSGLLVVALVGGLLTVLAPEGAVAAPVAPPTAAATAPDLTRAIGVLFRVTPTDPITGEWVALDASVGAGTLRKVTLERDVGNRWMPVTTRLTASDGSVRFTVKATTTPIVYRVVVAPDSRRRLPAITSQQLKLVGVVANVALRAAETVEVGSASMATVQVTPRRTGTPIVLQKKSGATWATVLRATLSEGRVVLRLPSGAIGETVVYRAVVSAASGAPALISASVSVRTVKPRPVVTSLAPSTGTLAGGTTVTATGRRLSDVTEVLVGGAPAAFEIVSDTQLTFITPSGTPGSQKVQVRSEDGEALRTFSYELDEDLLDEEFVAAAGTYVVDPARLVAVDATPIDPATEDQVTVTRHIVTLTADGPLPDVGDGFFLAPSDAGEGGDGVAGSVSAIVDVGDGTAAITVDTAPLTDVLDSYSFEASTIADDGSAESVEGEPESDSRMVDSSTGPRSGAREIAAAEEDTAARSSIGIAQLGPSMFDCARDDGSPYALTAGFEGSLTLENTRVYSKTAYGLGERYVRTYLYTEAVLRVVGNAEFALDCELSDQFVDSMRRTLHLSYGFTLSIAPSAEFHVNAQGGFHLEQRWVREIGYEQTNDDAPKLINNTLQMDPTARLSADIVATAYAGIDIQLGWMDVIGLVVGIGIEAGLEFHAVVVPDPQICVTFSAAVKADIRLFIDLWERWEREIWEGTHTLFDVRQCWKPDEVPQPDTPRVDGFTEIPAEVTAERGLSWIQLNGTIEDMTLDPSAPGYIISSGLYVPAGATLTIPAGARVKLGHCNWSIWWPNQPCLRVDGTLRVEGTSALPVVFTSTSDDQIGGDTDGDVPNASTRWKGIWAGTGARVEINHLFARMTDGFINASASEYVELRSSEIQGGGGMGVVLGDTPGLIRYTTFGGFSTPFLVGGIGPVDEVLISDVTVRNGQAQISGATTLQSSRFENATLRVGAENAALRDLHFQGPNTPITTTVEGAGASYAGIRIEGAVPAILVEGGALYPDSDVTWSAPLPYALGNTIVIKEGATLRWAAGVNIHAPYCRPYNYYPSEACIRVEGALHATGTPGRPVRLDLDSDGIWATSGGAAVTLTDVKINGGYRALLTDSGATLAATRLTVAGGNWGSAGEAVVMVRGTGAASIRQSSITAGSVALWVTGESPAVVEQTTVTRGILINYSKTAVFTDVVLDMPGETAPLRTSAEGAGAGLDVEFTAGTPDYVEVRSSGVSGEVTWDADLDFHVIETIAVAEGGSLTFAPGTVVKFQHCRGWSSDSARPCITVEGELYAVGTAEDPVRLLSAGGAFFPFSAVGTSVISLDHVQTEGPYVLLQTSGSARATVRNTEIVDGQGNNFAVLALGATVPATVEETSIEASWMAIMVTMSPASLDGVSFTGGYRGLVNQVAGTVLADSSFQGVTKMIESSETMSAPRNWWGDPTGPPSGTVIGAVTDISPWCLDAACATLG